MMAGNSIENIRKRKPVVHCITNYVTVNDCANIVLAAGGTPVMADHPDEVEDITNRAQALLLNLGTMRASTQEAMLRAGKAANHKGIPVVLDPVGVAASPFRLQLAKTILEQVRVTAIKGNWLEMGAILGDPSSTFNPERLTNRYAKQTRHGNDYDELPIYVMTGPTDYVCYNDRDLGPIIRCLDNGNALMERISGAGCMAGAILATFLGADPNPAELLSQDHGYMTCRLACDALAAMGVAGELAFENLAGRGTGTYRTLIIDAISLLDDETLARHAKMRWWPE